MFVYVLLSKVYTYLKGYLLILDVIKTVKKYTETIHTYNGVDYKLVNR